MMRPAKRNFIHMEEPIQTKFLFSLEWNFNESSQTPSLRLNHWLKSEPSDSANPFTQTVFTDGISIESFLQSKYSNDCIFGHVLFCNGKPSKHEKIHKDYFRRLFYTFVPYFLPFQIFKWRQNLQNLSTLKGFEPVAQPKLRLRHFVKSIKA